MGLSVEIGRGIEIIFEANKEEYFKKFNSTLRKTDILWTKPSELSFYAGLGMPVIMAPPIGSQEKFNKKWLLATGAGVEQENPKYASEWIFDWLGEGIFMKSAINGYFETEKYGTFNIEKIIFGEPEKRKIGKDIIKLVR